MKDDLISRQGMCDSLNKYRIEKMLEGKDVSLVWECIDKVLQEPSARSELIRCKDCIFGYLYIDVQNGFVNSWIECRNPEGLNRDVFVDGYCSASIRRMDSDSNYVIFDRGEQE